MAKLPKYFYFRVTPINKGTGVRIEEANDADVVEVVRCRDCVHGEVDDTDFPNQYLCHFCGDDWNDAMHYCSYGERKLNNDRSGQGASGAPEGDPDAEGRE